MLQRFWRWTTQPDDSIQDPIQYREVRLLMALLAGIIPVGTILVGSIALWGAIPFLTILFGAFALARVGHYKLATLITIATIFCATCTCVIISHNGCWFVYLIVPVLVSSLYHRLRTTTILGAVQLAGPVLYILLFQPPYEDIPIFYYATVSSIILIATRYRNAIEAGRRTTLSASEKRYRTLAANFPNGIVLLFDRELRCILVDGQGLAPPGMEKARIEGRRLPDAIPPDIHHSLVPLFRAALKGRASSTKLTINGGTHRIHVLPIIEADDTITAGMVMSQNITDQVQMETALREERNLFVGGPVVVFKWEAQAGWPVEYVSPNIQEQFGYPPAAFISGQIKYADIIYPADLQRIAPTPRAFTHPDMPTSEKEYRIADAKGEFRWVYDYTTVLYDDDGNPTHLHGYLLDITQRKHAEQELAKHRDQLEDLVNERTAELQAANVELQNLTRLKDEFVSNVSHELRTPITNLKLYQKLIRENPSKTDSYLAVLQRETDRLHLIIENLLNLSRLDQDQVKPRFVCTDLNTLIAEYAEDRAPLIKRQGLTLALETTADPLTVRADPDLLGQVLSILLTNAVNYTPSGGHITIRTLSRLDGADALAGFRVIDTGQGIPPEDLERLFERFYRGSVGLQSGKPGTGLGLAIAEEIVGRHKGYIEAANAQPPQTGAIFTVWLPHLDH